MTSQMLEPAEVRGTGSGGITYQQLLDSDSRPVPDVLRWQSAVELPPAKVPIARYTSQEFFDLEVEKLWTRVWQMACREEDIPEVGDHTVYDIVGRSILLVRSAPDTIQAFHNTCLHRGRALKDHDGRSSELRCPFHGWAWNLDGSLKTIPCRWDFPHVARDEYALPEVQVGCWGGFVFVNLDSDCVPFEDWIGDLPRHFERWPLEERYKEVHVSKLLPCNWKVAQEAFMEAYHVIGTHPQLLPGIGDSNSQYDVWGNFSRAITANMTPSPHLAEPPSEQAMLDSMTDTSIDEEPMLRVDGTDEAMTARRTLAMASRMQIGAAVPGIGDISDAEMCDSFYYTLFPNFHPWGAYNRIVYRFKPHGLDPHHCTMEVMYLSPFRGKRPKAAAVHHLAIDEDWTQAPEIGFLTRVFNQDTGNLDRVQAGLRGAQHTHVTFAQYQETKIRHFHALLDRFVSA